MTSEYKSKFQELRQLGSGGFSSVFEVISIKDGNKYAVKKIPFKDEEMDKTFKEIIFFGELVSDFVVRYYHSWVENNYYNNEIHNKKNVLFNPEKPLLLHIQMELCSMTLQQFIINAKCLNKDSLNTNYYNISCEIFVQLLECVHYLHSHNPQIIHRDLKPQNILLTNGDNNRCVKLTDFGLSTFHLFAEQSHTSRTGTAFYKAPEVINRQYSIKADIYSIGMIMKDLFNIDFARQSIKNSEIQQKYNNLKKICLSCLSQLPDQRPKCKKIMKKIIKKFNQNSNENLIMKITKITELCYETVFKFNFEKWPLIKNINLEFLKNCKYMSVIEEFEIKAIILTKDKNVYASTFRYNINKTLEEPIIIKDLINKEIEIIMCGKYHVLFLTKDMDVYSFGDNTFGQLGNGTYISNNKPTIINELKDKRILDIKCGAYHSLALSENGIVFVWGFGGWVLNANNNNQNTPIEIISLSSEKIKLIACGYLHCLALSENGTLYGWGYNDCGQLGIRNYDDRIIPTVIRFDYKITIKKISCGRYHSLVLTSDNDIYSFGYGYHKNGSTRNQNTPIKVQTKIKFIDIETIFCEEFSVGLSIDNNYYIWGQSHYQLNEWFDFPKQTNCNSFFETFYFYSLNHIPYNITEELSITKREVLKVFKKIETFKNLDQHMIANLKSLSVVKLKECETVLVTNDNNVYSFRLNESIDRSDNEPIFVNQRIKKIACGFEHVLYLTENNEVYSFGDNAFGQLGDGYIDDNYVSTFITDLSDKRIFEISCGANHCLALSESGNAFGWGFGWFGQIGNNQRQDMISPNELFSQNYNKIISITCGAYHCLALSSTGNLFVWGDNRCGQLGIGNNNNQYKPIRYENSNKIIITKISCGRDFSLLLTNEFIIYSCGSNYCGQLGIGNETDSNQFIKIKSDIKFIDIHTNWCIDFSAGLSQTGKYYVWGKCGDEVITTPKQTDFTSFDEICAKFSTFRFSYQPIILNKI